MHVVNQPIRKKDAMALLTGQPVYTDDLAPKDCLFVKLLRSPHARAEVLSVDREIAYKAPGIACILTYEDVPDSRFTMAGQSFPEPSPYDHLILDRILRCVGDPVAIVAGETEEAVDRALSLLRVKYAVKEPLLDFRCAKDHAVLVHPEENFRALCPDVGADAKRNLCATGSMVFGDVEAVLAECDYVVEETYHTKANHQAMMETFRTYSYLDTYGRLVVVSSTQVPFHVRRILSNALEIPKSQIRVVKPRIGGGFGAKQSVVSEVFPAIVTLKTGKSAKMVYSRKESFTNGSPRHEMEMKIRLGADKDGRIRAISMYTLSNAGAYGEHGPTTVGLTGTKAMSLYSGADAYSFIYDVVYTNTMGGGAYRGYGATQGLFALESAVNELAEKLSIDPTVLRERNMVKVGDTMKTYYGETLKSCALDRCMAKAKELIGWKEKLPKRKMENGKVRAVGCAMAMQGSGISGVDIASAEMKLSDGGFYTLMIGAADMGTGCDTILSQMAAEYLCCEVDNIIVHGVDTDLSPYDTGSYASSTTYVTGMAVVKTCESLKQKMFLEAAKVLHVPAERLELSDGWIFSLEDGVELSVSELANLSYMGGHQGITACESHFSPVSPPPFMVGMAEVEVDLETGKVDVLDYVGVVDCGTPVNPNLARVQAEGGILQGIGMALFEDIQYSREGRMLNDSFMQYKIPSRLDIGRIRVAFESSYEPTGPFGAKSIGEIVINTPAPAIADAVYHATGLRIRELPITAEKIAMGVLHADKMDSVGSGE